MSKTREFSVVSSQSTDPGFCVAFASSDRRLIDQHFGHAEHFLIYSLGEEAWRLDRVLRFEDNSAGHSEGKLQSRVDALSAVQFVYCNAIGGSASRKLLQAGAKAQIVPENTAIAEVLQDLRQQAELGHFSRSKTNFGASKQEHLNALLDEDW